MDSELGRWESGRTDEEAMSNGQAPLFSLTAAFSVGIGGKGNEGE